MALLKTSRQTVVRLVFVLVLMVVAIMPAYAACTQGQTQWRTTGCCACNSAYQQTLWSCNNGVWVNTGYSQCNNYGSCCKFPCCV